MNNFLKHLIPSYLFESKDYCHQGGKFYLPKFNCVHQVSVLYINVKIKLVQTFVTLQKGFTKNVEITALQVTKIK